MTFEGSGQRDWYRVERELLSPIAKVPGLRQIKRSELWELHRSHLPLLDSDDARRALWVASARSLDDTWAQRDKATASRGFKLRPVQHAGVDYITKRRGVLLGDDMRVGKSATAAMSHEPGSGTLVVICPAMVRPVWINWLSRIYPDESIGVLAGREFDPKVLDRHTIIVGHYDILAWWQSWRPIGTIIFDEAHYLSKASSKRSEAATLLASRAERVICLTGTPIWNMPTGLWNILSMIAPGAFGSYYDFCGRYGAPVPSAHGTKYTGISNEEELRARLSEVMIRRRWVDVQADLPAISRNIVLVDLDNKTRQKLDLMAAEISSDKTATIGLLARYREQLAKVKANHAFAAANEMITRGEPVVVWTWHTELAKKLAIYFGEAGFLVTGEVSPGDRQKAIEAWNAHPAGALVCTMAVAQVGLDFSHARLAVFAEIDYTPAILAQAEMRTYAPTRPMNVTYVVANHVIDQRIVLALTKKLDAANPLGVAAANDAISMLHGAIYGQPEEADLDRLLEDVLAS